ncbi:hypothetical protein BH23GEM7_BH23GEM7_35160 [soil metagenome]
MTVSGRVVPSLGYLLLAALCGCVPATLDLSGISASYSPLDRAGRDARAVERQGAIHILHPYLAARLDALEALSPRFHAEMEALRRGDVLVYLGTAEPVSDPAHEVMVKWKMPKDRIGEFSAVRDPESGRVKALVVRVNLPQIVERHSRWRRERASPWERRLTPAALLEEAVDGILIHELWGHLIPVAGGRNDLSYCRDPRPGEADLASCVMQRENDLRQEMGMRPRTRYKWNRYARPI